MYSMTPDLTGRTAIVTGGGGESGEPSPKGWLGAEPVS